MEFFTNDVIRSLLANSLETAELSSAGFKDIGKGPGSRAAESIEFLTIANQAQPFTNDVERIRNHRLVSPSIPIDGYLYDVTSGKLIAIETATKAGAAKIALTKIPGNRTVRVPHS